jgi:hypothetical protein
MRAKTRRRRPNQCSIPRALQECPGYQDELIGVLDAVTKGKDNGSLIGIESSSQGTHRRMEEGD